jgi:hypothetical protein
LSDLGSCGDRLRLYVAIVEYLPAVFRIHQKKIQAMGLLEAG